MEVYRIETRYDQGVGLTLKFIKKVFPEVSRELKSWTNICRDCSSEVFAKQALSSIRLKRFHSQGGCIFALYPKTDLHAAIKFIVSLQTISDYLDNLCDRTDVADEHAFRQLHLSMLDAVDPERDMSPYFRFYPYGDDSGYLNKLVEKCRCHVRNLPSYNLVIDTVKKYVHLYSDLQSYKHLNKKVRENCLKTWAGYYKKQYPDISCWEFSAAAGSTLGIFVMYASAHDPDLTTGDVKALDAVYFPWICGLHILLDYYIDAHEDLRTGDLNFTFYYKNLKQCEGRLTFFMERAYEQCSSLPYPEFHRTIIRGLLAMYLSDPKASLGMNRLASRNILKNSKPQTVFYYKLCKFLRFAGIL